MKHHFFRLAIDRHTRDDQNALTDFLIDELETKKEFKFNVWVESGHGSLDNLGSCSGTIASLYGQKKEPKEFVDENTKEKIEYNTRTYTTQSSL